MAYGIGGTLFLSSFDQEVGTCYRYNALEGSWAVRTKVFLGKCDGSIFRVEYQVK